MTHYYFYIDAGQSIDLTTKFYKVAVGESKRERSVLKHLTQYAAAHGHYFSLVNQQSFDFVQNCIRSLEPSAPNIQHIRGWELLRNFRNTQATPLSENFCHNRHQLSLTLDLDYRISSRISLDR